MSKFYITTPLYYVNDEPHIGHAYTTILADVLARYQRILGNDVFFLTGTDEHGQKVQEAAEKRNVKPEEHVNEYVLRFKDVWKQLNINYDDFIRTTEKRHTDRVKEVLNHLKNKGDIYLSEYEGLYSVSEERFITDKEAEEGNFKEIKVLKEKNYFFKMSKYQKQLIQHIQSHPDFIQPETRKNEIIGFLKQNLNDLCISRPKSRLSWGIELPFDKEYVAYVWFDALLNYITAIGWGSDEKKFLNYWPANYHLMGKDILTTHCVYWPTMLLACNIELPKTIFAHGWWLMEKEKMSKSVGNTIKPLELVADYGVDALRYFLMRNMVLGQDASYSFKIFKERYNADLANDFGNLVNRIFILIKKNYDAKVVLVGYDILFPKILSLAFESMKIRTIAVQERFLTTFLSNYPFLVDTYMCNSELVCQKIKKSNNKFVNNCIPCGQIRSDILVNYQKNTNTNNRFTITAFDFHSDSNFNDNRLNVLINWKANASFYKDLCNLAEEFSELDIIIRGKNTDWTEIPYFKDVLNKVNSISNI